MMTFTLHSLVAASASFKVHLFAPVFSFCFLFFFFSSYSLSLSLLPTYLLARQKTHPVDRTNHDNSPLSAADRFESDRRPITFRLFAVCSHTQNDENRKMTA
jgi:hypothetical protein